MEMTSPAKGESLYMNPRVNQHVNLSVTREQLEGKGKGMRSDRRVC